METKPPLSPESSWHLALVLARQEHARITRVETAAALALPGVARVITAADLRGTNRLAGQPGVMPVLCQETVRRWGDIVAVTAANTRRLAREAARRVSLSCIALPTVPDFAAAASGTTRLHPETPNVFLEQPLYKGHDPRPLLDQAAFVAECGFSTVREPHLPLEPECIRAWPEAGGVSLCGKSQDPHGMIRQMAPALGLPAERLRILALPAGGSFGSAISPLLFAVTAACALVLDAPVSLVLSYEEHLLVTGKRAPVRGWGRLACDAAGRLLAGDFLVHVDQGAYGGAAQSLTGKMVRFFGAPYRLPHLRGLVRTAFTNGNFGTSAFGTPQAHILGETLMDMLARQTGLDPFVFRWHNLAQPGDTGPTSALWPVYPMRAMMARMRPVYQRALRAARQEDRANWRRGVGLAWGGDTVSGCPDQAAVDLVLQPDGSLLLCSSWAELGQGADLGAVLLALQALKPLGLSPGQIHLARNDSALCPDSGPTTSNRGLHAVGLAIGDAAEQMLAVRRGPRGFRSWQELRELGLPTRFRGQYRAAGTGLDPASGQGWGVVQQNFALFLAEVAVSPASGKVQVLGAHIVADVGRIVSRQSVLGQVWGVFAQAVGFTLTVPGDNPGQRGPVDAGIPCCLDVPDRMTVDLVETPRSNGPFGATGAAEGFQSAGCTAILNAIFDAVGLRLTQLPITPAKVRAALAGQTEEVVLPRWNPETDLYAQLARVQSRGR